MMRPPLLHIKNCREIGIIGEPSGFACAPEYNPLKHDSNPPVLQDVPEGWFESLFHTGNRRSAECAKTLPHPFATGHDLLASRAVYADTGQPPSIGQVSISTIDNTMVGW